MRYQAALRPDRDRRPYAGFCIEASEACVYPPSGVQRAVMALSQLTLTNFRNYDFASIAPGSSFVVLTGENGSGKTNCLEAVSLLAPGRGLRRAALVDMDRGDGPGGFTVSVQLGDVSIGTGTTAEVRDRRIVRINGANASTNALSEWLSVIWLTPTMDRIFADSGGERRRFLDRLVLALDPQHARHSTRYEAAMRQRNRLLADDRLADPEWLSALEAQMVEHGVAIADARASMIAALSTRIAGAPEGPFAKAGLAMDGWTARDKLAIELAAGRARDASAGRTLVGPHRSDLGVTHVAKGQPAARCSTGEQKALLLGIVLAHADLVAERVGRRPILLLDEVAAHLDPIRRTALFERLDCGGSQVWMTGTEPGLFEALGTQACRLHVEPGRISPA
jgi:DNA replication and repair protein RecF